MVTPWTTTVWSGGELAIAAALCRQVDDHGARRHTADHVLGDQHGRGLARNRRSRSRCRCRRPLCPSPRAGVCKTSPSCALEYLSLSSASPAPRGSSNEFSTHRTHLIGHGRTHVVGAHHGAEPARAGDRRSPGDAAPITDTRAGTNAPARVFVIGAGVAGLRRSPARAGWGPWCAPTTCVRPWPIRCVRWVENSSSCPWEPGTPRTREATPGRRTRRFTHASAS